MADIVAAEIPTRKRGSRKAPLIEKTNNDNESPLSENFSEPKKGKAASKKQQEPKQQSFEQDLLEMQEKLQQLRLEKEKTEELLKEKDEILKQKDEELENREKEQEKLQIELKKLSRKNIQEERPETGGNMLKTLVSLKWKDMSEEGKEIWNGKASEAMEAYKKEMEEYNKSIVAKIEQKTD